MKSLYLTAILWGLALSGNINATIRDRVEIPKGKDFTKQEILGDIQVNGRTFHVIAPPDSKKVTRFSSSSSGEVIKEAPGEVRYYCKDVIGYGAGQPVQAYGIASTINWDGDEAYFLDIITAAPMGTYVKGTKENGKIVLPMDQTVLDYDDEEYTLKMGLLRPVFSETTDSEGDTDIFIWFEYSNDYESVTYNIEPNGSLILENPKAKYKSEGHDPSYYNFPDYVIGYYFSDDYQWNGYCDALQAYDEFNFEKIEMPENLDLQTLTYINEEGTGVIVYVGETEKSMYIKGLSAYAPDAVFKADILEDGKKISVAPNQYIGIESDIYYIITSTGFIEDGEIDVVEDDQPVYFNVERDPQTGKILSITADDSPYFLVFNDDPFYFYPLDIFKDLTLTMQESFAGVPATPYDVYYGNYGMLMGANFIFFRLSSFAKNGDIIDINNLYYQIFINSERVEFEEEVGFNLLDEESVMYSGIKEPTYLVPYTFANNIDLYEDLGGTFVVGLYAEGIQTVGIQGVYVYEGTTTKGDLVTIDTKTGEETVTPGTDAGLDSISSAEVVAVEYYNLNGHKILNPGQGLYIKKYRLSDGSVRSNKVIIR